MSGIDVSTGGRTSVDTDELHERAMFLDLLASTVSAWRMDVREAVARVASVPEAASVDLAHEDLSSAMAALERAAEQAASVGAAAAVAASLYGGADRAAASFVDWMGALAGRSFGLLASATLPALIAPAAVWALPVAVPALIAGGVAWAHPVSRRAIMSVGAEVGAWLLANGRHVAHPAAAGLVRAAVSASDDVLTGAARLPTGTGSAGLAGVVGSPLVGAAIRATDTPVTVAPSGGPRVVTPPTTVADLAQRIPANAAGGPQIRVERYTGPDDETSWAVYVGGTVEVGLGPGDEAFDVESAIGSMAGEDGAAYRAVVQAMDDAGVSPGDRVTLAGHSQGGLVAAAVAESGDYSVDSLVTFGAPSAQIAPGEGVTTVAVEHSDDLVPALAGQPPVDDERTVVSRDTVSREQEGDSLLSAHSLAEYERTAELMDRSEDQRMVGLRESLERIAPPGGSGAAVDYRAERVAP